MAVAEVDPEFQKMWDEVVDEYKKMFNRDLKEKVSLEAENLLATIKEDMVDKEEKPKWEKAKKYLGNTLLCISRLGMFVIQGAGNAFQPAQLCFNATCFLIDTAQQYARIFSGLNELFEKIWGFLDRFEVYTRAKVEGVKIDRHLKSIIHRLLCTFVRICALSTKLITKRAKIRAALSAFAFGSDQGVKDAMSCLQSLIEEEAGMTRALMLEAAQNSGARTAAKLTTVEGKLDDCSRTASFILETAQDGAAKLDMANGTIQNVNDIVEGLHKAEKHKEEQNFMRRNKKTVKDLLKIRGEDTWKEQLDDLSRDAVEGTGRWLLESERLTAWKADREADDTNPVFALEASRGFGKSMLCARVIEHLKDTFKNGNQTERSHVAFFFFEETRSSEGWSLREDGLSMNNALRKIVWQLTLQDIAYQKFVASLAEGSDSFTSNTVRLWERAIRDYKRTNVTFFIVLDGIDKAKKELGKTQPLVRMLQDIATMAQDTDSLLRIRLFLTGQAKDFSELVNESGIPIHRVALGQVNRDDILQFINIQLEGMPADHIQDDLRTTICEKLLESSGGNYLKLSPILKELRKKRRRNEIEATLACAGEDPQQALRKQVEELNTLLDAQDVEDLNELLAWVCDGVKYFSVDEMETVLFLKNRASRENSLVTLARQIEEKYSMLLEIDGDGDVVATSTLLYIKDLQSEQQDTGEAEEMGIHNNVNPAKLHEAEVAIVSRFLRQVCDDKLFAKFGFEELFKSKLDKKPAKINFQASDGHLRILLTSLKAICGDDRDKARPLHEYAIYGLSHHLSNVDLAHAETKTKQEIGALLVQLFINKNCIRTWWTEQVLPRGLLDYTDDLAEVALPWFKDSVTVEGLSNDDRCWVNEVLSGPKPEEGLLKPITRIAARDWLQSFKWPLTHSFNWLRAYIDKTERRKSIVERAVEGGGDDEVSADMIYAIEKWAKRELDVDVPDVQWIVRVACTLNHFGHEAEAVEKWRLALTIDPHSWMVELLHIHIQLRQKVHEACLKTALALAQRFRDDEGLRREFACSWKNVLRTVAEAYHHLGQHGDCARATRQLLDEFPHDYGLVVDIIGRLEKQGAFCEVIALLEELGTRRPEDEQKDALGLEQRSCASGSESQHKKDNKSSGHTPLITLYHDFACCDDFDDSSDIFHSRVARAGRATGNMEFVYKTFRDSVDAAESSIGSLSASRGDDERKRSRVLAGLRYHHALTLFHHGDGVVDITTAVSLLECNARPNTTLLAAWAIRRSARVLAGLYVHLAKLAGLGSTASEQWTKRLRTLVDAQMYQGSSDGMLLVEASLALGRLLHLSGRKKEACEAVREYVHVALDLLDDDDPKNDWNAYLLLGWTLAPLGDDENALAAWELIRPWMKEQGGDQEGEGCNEQRVDDSEEEATTNTSVVDVACPKPSTDDEHQDALTSLEDGAAATATATSVDEDGKEDQEPTPPRLEGPLSCLCDGNCGTSWKYADDIHACKDCYDVQFCSVCVDKLRAGTLECQVCSPDHTFLHVPRWVDIVAADEAAGGVPEGSVRVGKQVLTIKEWINGIRVRWGFPTVE